MKDIINWYFTMDYQTAVIWAASCGAIVWTYILYKLLSSRISKRCQACRNTGLNDLGMNYCHCRKGQWLQSNDRAFYADMNPILLQRISSYSDDPRD